ncbi:MAG: hypothetical protein K0R65_1457 [Crocinitomicaceae bacterium]|jgi:hypothetical protein|nr:hypothetical protein [Crocinitomicaceae bacterium]
MLSKEALKEKNTAFWNDFKEFMRPIRSSNGRKMAWISYPTDIRHIYLRLHVSKSEVALQFDIQYKDATVRAVFWEQMNELKKVLTDEMGEEGEWIEHCWSDSVPDFCRIQWKREGLNYLKESDQPEIFEFFKEKLIAFDAFYQEFKDILIFLAK